MTAVCLCFQQTLYSHGWCPLTGIDISRKNHDKSVIAFSKTSAKLVPFACIALSDEDKLRVIDFPAYEQERLAEEIRSTYAYGLIHEKNVDEHCREFKLHVS